MIPAPEFLDFSQRFSSQFAFSFLKNSPFETQKIFSTVRRGHSLAPPEIQERRKPLDGRRDDSDFLSSPFLPLFYA